MTAYLLAAVAAIAVLLTLAMTFFAVQSMSAGVEAVLSGDPDKGFKASIDYDDHLYAALGYGIEVDPADPERQSRGKEFLADTMHLIAERVAGTDMLYAMLAGTCFALFLSERWGDDRKKHVLAVFCCITAIWIVLFGGYLCFCAVLGIPVRLPSVQSLILLCVSLLSAVGGSCIAGLLLTRFRFRKIAAILLIPLVFALFLFGSLAEAGLMLPKEVESFSYVAEFDPEGVGYYDPEKNAVIVEDKEYPPQISPNPDRLTGAGAVLATAFEAVNPYSGNSIELVRQMTEEPVPVLLQLFYALKALGWILLSAAGKKKN